jgi:uncharacterized protein with PQ loop repeat
MTLGLVLGWLGALTALSTGLPQVARLIRAHDCSGVSAAAWTLCMGSAIGWASHGVQLGLINQVVPNTISCAASFTVLYQIHRMTGQPLLPRVAPALAIGLTMGCVDFFLGVVVFGLIGAMPGAAATVAQGTQLVRAPRVTGVPVLALALGLSNSLVWFSWGLFVNEPGTAIASSIGGILCLFNLVWRVLRSCGLRAFFAMDQVPATKRQPKKLAAKGRPAPPHRREEVRPRRGAPAGRRRVSGRRSRSAGNAS